MCEWEKIKPLTVVDEYTRECSATEMSGRIRSLAEFISGAILEWASKSRIDIAFIEQGKHWQNELNESFNGKFRAERLSAKWFRNRLEAKVVIEDWRQHCNAIGLIQA